MSVKSTRRLTASEVKALDPYMLMAVLGKRVIHPGGRSSTEELFRRADFAAEMMTPAGIIGDEDLANSLKIMGRALSRACYLKKMAWLMPRMNHAVPTSATSRSLA